MTQKYQVKVSMKQAAIVETGIVLKQGDFGMQIEIEVLDFDATGTTPQIVFRKAMGAVESTTITVSGNKYTYTFKGTELDTPGKCFCDLKLKNSTTQRISTASFMFKVVADTLDGLAEEASSYSDTIQQLLANTLQKSNTAGLVKNDGTINEDIENDVSTLKIDASDLKRSVYQGVNTKNIVIDPTIHAVDGNRASFTNENTRWFSGTSCTVEPATELGNGVHFTSQTASNYGIFQDWFITKLPAGTYKFAVKIKSSTSGAARVYFTGYPNPANSGGTTVARTDFNFEQSNNYIKYTGVITVPSLSSYNHVRLNVAVFSQTDTSLAEIVLVPETEEPIFSHFRSGIDKTEKKISDILTTPIILTNNQMYNIQDEAFVSSNKRVSMAEPQQTGSLKIIPASGEKYGVVQFHKVGSTGVLNDDYEYITWTGWKTGTDSYVFDSDIYIFVMVAYTNDGNISPNQYKTLIYSYAPSDKFVEKKSVQVGEVIAERETQIIKDTLCIKILLDTNMMYNVSNESFSTNSKRISMSKPELIDSISVVAASGEQYGIVLFSKIDNTGDLNTDYEYISWTGWKSATATYTFDDVYVYVMLKKTSESNISPLSNESRIYTYDKLSGYVESKISEKIETSGEYAIPTYYKQHIIDKNKQINDIAANIGANGDGFIFITDMHYIDNAQHSPSLINSILRETPINWVHFGGDFFGYRMTDYTQFVNVMKGFDRVASARGNHEKVPNAGVPSEIVSDSEYYSIYIKPWEEHLKVNRELYFYRDSEAQKTRYIFLDTGDATTADNLSAEQLSWMKNRITELTSEWYVLILVHVCLKIKSGGVTDAYVEFGPNGELISTAISEISGNTSCKVLGVICGHMHTDGWDIDQTNGYFAMSTSCDAYGTQRTNYDIVNTNVTPGTIYEQLFDVYQNDYENHILYATRIGSGGNRTLHYEPIVISENYTLTPEILESVSSWSIGNGATSIITVNNGVVTPVANGYALCIAWDSDGNREAWNIKVEL